ncbi:MAG: hypothetical protein J07HX64_02005 [halophilic archaeon J07HX64]|jgi:Uncharacterized protein conserved in archaea|nr:MAG: hypothetical protein J07HX64_02005 [halophilic archaeon J07HX64]
MNLDELQSVRDRERQTDKPQQLRESFYADVGSFVEQLRTERDRAAERHGSPYADEVMRLTDEIDAAQQLVEDIHERRIGKVVKAASLEAAELSPEIDGLTTEEQALFDDLVADIEHHREDVLATVEGQTSTDATADQTSLDATGIDAAGVMGADTTDSESPPSLESTDRSRPEHADPGEMRPDTAPGDRPVGNDPQASGPARTDGNGSRPDDSSEDKQGRQRPDPGEKDLTRNGHTDAAQNGHDDTTQTDHSDTPRKRKTDTTQTGHAETVRSDSSDAVQSAQTESNQGGRRGAESTERDADRSGSTGDASNGTDQAVSTARGDSPSGSKESVDTREDDIERERVLVIQDVDTFVGSDARDYDLAADDVVTLPATNAEILVRRDAARRV